MGNKGPKPLSSKHSKADIFINGDNQLYDFKRAKFDDESIEILG